MKLLIEIPKYVSWNEVWEMKTLNGFWRWVMLKDGYILPPDIAIHCEHVKGEVYCLTLNYSYV